MIFPFKIFYCYFFPILVYTFRSEIRTVSPLCPKYIQDNIIIVISTWNINTIHYPRLPLVSPNQPGTIHYNLSKPSGYDQMLCEKNMWLTELQLFINNIARCLSILDIIYARIQDYWWNNLIQCYTLFKTWLSTTYIYTLILKKN